MQKRWKNAVVTVSYPQVGINVLLSVTMNSLWGINAMKIAHSTRQTGNTSVKQG